MLIRSQDKSRLINLDNTRELRFWECAQGFDITDCVCPIGRYSTKEKAMKALNMIQEAYSDFESAKITSTGLATAAYAISLNYDTPENVFDGINALKEYGDSIKELMVFQMPADSEVEV